MSQAKDLEDSRAQVAEEIKFDILAGVSKGDNDLKRSQVARTFISDTITVPTEEMYSYAVLASLGDDVYHEPSTSALEAHIAKIAGKEAGLFMASG
jgi:threonine aldolase